MPVSTGEATEEELRRLIGELDARKFAAREAATRRLRELGPKALPALRDALARTPTPEVRKRIEELLPPPRPKDVQLPKGEDLRQLRAVWALELSGRPAARRVLEALAKGSPEPRVAQESLAALKRLVAP